MTLRHWIGTAAIVTAMAISAWLLAQAIKYVLAALVALVAIIFA